MMSAKVRLLVAGPSRLWALPADAPWRYEIAATSRVGRPCYVSGAQLHQADAIDPGHVQRLTHFCDTGWDQRCDGHGDGDHHGAGNGAAEFRWAYSAATEAARGQTQGPAPTGVAAGTGDVDDVRRRSEAARFPQPRRGDALGCAVGCLRRGRARWRWRRQSGNAAGYLHTHRDWYGGDWFWQSEPRHHIDAEGELDRVAAVDPRGSR